MSEKPNVAIDLNENLSLCEYTNPKSSSYGFWLYDEIQGMNLAMREKLNARLL